MPRTEAGRKTRVELSFLGPPRAMRTEPDGQGTELVWRLRRPLQAVAYLALQPRHSASKDALTETLWPDSNADAIRRGFHPALSDARRTLSADGTSDGPTILFRQGSYQLSTEIDWLVDVAAFRDHLDAGRLHFATGRLREAAASWSTAWRLYRGPFLPGIETPWVGESRESLRESYLDLLRSLGRVRAELGQLTESLDAYRSALFEEPYEEEVHRAVMELYGRRGRRDLVRRQYVRLQEHLEELGVEPLAETQACYHRLMR